VTQATQSPANHLRVVREGELVPPADLDAEAAVLSALVLDASAMAKVMDFLRPEHFFSEAHRAIYDAAAALFLAKEPVDEQTVASWLRARGRLVQVGGVSRIAEIMQASPAVANVRAHALAVHDMFRRRKMILACQRAAIAAHGAVPDVQHMLDATMKTVALIAAERPLRPVESNASALQRILDDAFRTDVPESRDGVAMSGFPTGLYGIDRKIGGLRKGAKTTIVASTGVGKSAFAMQMSIELAKQGVGVLFFSMELKREELLRRALSYESNVSANRIKNRRLNDRDRENLVAAKQRLDGLPWRIEETPKPTIEQIAAVTKSVRDEMLLVDRVPLAMVVVDYIQRVAPSKHMMGREERQQIAHATEGLKILAQELDIVALELAQQKDAIPGKKVDKPKGGSMISDTSKIGKESDDIIYLLSEGRIAPGDPRVSIDAWIAKNRAGEKETGVSLLYRGDLYRFTDPNAPGGSVSRQYLDTRDETEEHD